MPTPRGRNYSSPIQFTATKNNAAVALSGESSSSSPTNKKSSPSRSGVMLSPRLSGANPVSSSATGNNAAATISTAAPLLSSSSQAAPTTMMMMSSTSNLNNMLNNAIAANQSNNGNGTMMPILIGKGVEPPSNGNTAAHRRAVKKAEQRAMEYAATPILLSLADRRLRTQTRTTNATILGTTFQTNLPKGLALYRELVEAVAKIGLNQTAYTSSSSILAAADTTTNSLHENQHHQHSTSNTSNNSNPANSVSNSRLNTPLPPSSASALNTNNSNQNNRTPTPPPPHFATTTAGINTTSHQHQHPQFPLPFGILASDPPMVVQGKLLEVWASFLGGEPRRVAREQANHAKQTTAKIAKQVEEAQRLQTGWGGKSDAEKEKEKQQLKQQQDGQSPSRRSVVGITTDESTRNDTEIMNQEGYVIDEKNKNKESLKAFRKYSSSNAAAGENPLLCEVAQDNVEYPLVILRAIEAEEAERNPKAELELYIRHYEDVLARGEASNEGTIRELEVSVFVNLTYSLLNIVQLATHAKSLMIHTTQQQGNLMNTIAVMQQQLQMAQQQQQQQRPGSGGGSATPLHHHHGATTTSRSGSALNMHSHHNPRPSSPSHFVAALQNQQQNLQRPNSQVSAIAAAAAGTSVGGGGGAANSTTIFARPASSSSSLQTTARPNSSRNLLGMQTPTGHQSQQHQQNNNINTVGGATSPSQKMFSEQQHLQQHHSTIPEDDLLVTMQQSSAAMPIARVVCRPNSARALTAARKAPRGLDEVGMYARLLFHSEETTTTTATTAQQQQEGGSNNTSLVTSPQRHQSKPRPPTAPTNTTTTHNSPHQQQETEKIPYQNSSQQQQPSGQRIPVSYYWKGNITEAELGVGNAAQSVGPTTHGNNWSHASLGHQNFKQHARIDTARPRHGKALQTAAVSERIQTSVAASNAPHISQHPSVAKRAQSARALPTASSRVGHNVSADQASTRRGSTTLHSVNSMPTNWNQQRDEKWVLVEQ